MKLAVGIVLILLSIVHIIYGEKMQVSELKKIKASPILIGSYRVMSLQGGVLLFATGVVEILTYEGIIVLSGFSAFVPLGIICLNVLSCLAVAAGKHRELFTVTVPQLLIFAVVIVLQACSIR